MSTGPALFRNSLHFFALVLGVLAAAAGSIVLAMLSGFLIGYSSHPFETLPWIFAVSVVPTAVAALVLAIAAGRMPGASKRIWLVALFAALVTVAFSGALGAPIVQSLRVGFSRVNVSGYVLWSPIYAIVLLPVSFPLALGVARAIWNRRATAHT